MVVISAAIVNTGAGKKMEKKNSLDGSVSTRQTVADIVGDGGTTVVNNAKLGAGRLSRLSALGLEGGWTPTLVVVISAAVVNTGAGKKTEKKNSLDGSASTRRTVAIVVGDGGTTVVDNAKLGAGGLS